MITVDNGTGHGSNEDDGAMDILLLVHHAGSRSSSKENTGGVDVKDLEKVHESQKVSLPILLGQSGTCRQAHLLEVLDGVFEGIVSAEDTGGSHANVHRVRTRVLDDELHDGVDLVVIGD